MISHIKFTIRLISEVKIIAINVKSVNKINIFRILFFYFQVTFRKVYKMNYVKICPGDKVKHFLF